MSKWLNNKRVIYPNLRKPCIQLQYCPYGALVEEYPLSDSKLSCLPENGAIIPFGHDCPGHYLAEFVLEWYAAEL